MTDAIPIGLCQCGCGRRTPLATETNARAGRQRGQPTRFVHGHTTRTGIRAGGYPYIVRDGRFIKKHIAAAETALGHPLPEGAEVHHVDNDTRNFSNNNLVICQDHDFHHFLHVRARVVKAGGNPNTQRICSHCRSLTAFNDLCGGRLKPSALPPKGSSVCLACESSRRDRRRAA